MNYDLFGHLLAGIEGLGAKIDAERNAKTIRGAEGVISTEDSAIKIVVIPANEELVIAREVYRNVNAC